MVDARCLVLPSGSFVVFSPSKKHYSIGVNVIRDQIESIAYNAWHTVTDFARAAKGDDAELLHERLAHFSQWRASTLRSATT